jgi:hypothetical protein
MGSSGVERRIRNLELQTRFGQSRQLQFDLHLPVSFFVAGPLIRRSYFVIPVTAMLRGTLGLAKAQSGLVTGVKLEMNIRHISPVDFQISGVTLPSPLETESRFFDFREDRNLFSSAESRPIR